MLCPKCYGKIDKEKNRCDYCGFNLNELNNASNKEAKKALKGIYKDDVIYTSKLPADVSKKKLLLYAIFLGMFGAHHFYVGKFWQGFCMALITCVTLILGTFLYVTGSITDNIIQYAFEFSTAFQGGVLIYWISNIIGIIFNKYKVPVYKDSFSK
jgi:TM2 domain-containing membrane protein YozV